MSARSETDCVSVSDRDDGMTSYLIEEVESEESEVEACIP